MEREECIGANEWIHGPVILDLVAFKSQEYVSKLSLLVSDPCLSEFNAEFAALGFSSRQTLVAFSPFVLLRPLGELIVSGSSSSPSARTNSSCPVSSDLCLLQTESESRHRRVYLAISKARNPETEPETSVVQIKPVNPNSTPKTKTDPHFRIKKIDSKLYGSLMD